MVASDRRLPGNGLCMPWLFALRLPNKILSYVQILFSRSPPKCRDIISISSSSSTELYVGDARGDYYGESAGSYMVKEFK